MAFMSGLSASVGRHLHIGVGIGSLVRSLRTISTSSSRYSFWKSPGISGLRSLRRTYQSSHVPCIPNGALLILNLGQRIEITSIRTNRFTRAETYFHIPYSIFHIGSRY